MKTLNSVLVSLRDYINHGEFPDRIPLSAFLVVIAEDPGLMSEARRKGGSQERDMSKAVSLASALLSELEKIPSTPDGWRTLQTRLRHIHKKIEQASSLR